MDLGNITKEDYDNLVDTVKYDLGTFYASNGMKLTVDRKIANTALALCNSDIAWCNKMLRTIPPYDGEGPIVALLMDYEIMALNNKKKKQTFLRDILRNIIKDAGGPV